MTELHGPWLGLAVALPAVGAAWTAAARDPGDARHRSLLASGLALLSAGAAFLDLALVGAPSARDLGDLAGRLGLPGVLEIDRFGAPLLPLAALLFFLTELATLRTKVREFSFVRALASESLVLAALASRHPAAVGVLLVAGTILPGLELRRLRKPARAYALHMALFAALLGGGGLAASRGQAALAAALLAAAAGVRAGLVPAHCWVPDLFERAPFGTALLAVAPMMGAYAVVRLVLPIAPEPVLRGLGVAALATACYAAATALVQRDARRFFAHVFLSQSALVLVGLGLGSTLGLTAALCLWFSVSLSLTGFGLTLRCVETRTGPVSLAGYHGLYVHVPLLAALFLITGLASVGFPGTVGFVSMELLVDGTLVNGPAAGAAVVVVAALNGLAVLHAYFRVFTGTVHRTTIDLHSRPAERASVLILTALIVGLGLVPGPGVEGRRDAAAELAEGRPGGASPSHHLEPRPEPAVGRHLLEPVAHR